MRQSIGVLLDLDGFSVRPETEHGYASLYIKEILSHAGIPFEVVERADLRSDLSQYHADEPGFPPGLKLLILPWDVALADEEREAIHGFVWGGGVLIAMGGTSGLDDLLGCTSEGPTGNRFQEGYLEVTDDTHPITREILGPLHVFRGTRAATTIGHALARVKAQDFSVADAIVENATGLGHTLYVGPDLLYTIVHIQQGSYVPRQTRTVRYDTAAGLALDAQRDCAVVHGEEAHTHTFEGSIPGETQTRAFLEPVGDELRGIIIRGILYSCQKQRVALPLLWYWPGEVEAIAHLSHDTDGNNQERGWTLYHALADLRIKSTWCTLYPGGYTAEFYQALKARDYEIALHFDGTGSSEHTTWRQSNFNYQCDWLMAEAGIPEITTNKNHLLRWEGVLEFFKWCEAKDILVEESKGANNPVNNGFPFGGCHPWFPLDDDVDNPRFIDVLEINLMTQDINSRCTPHLAKLLADKVHKQYGVAHYLVHPGNTIRPEIEEGLREIVNYCREKGMPWWTAAEISRWERARRKVSIVPGQTDTDRVYYTVHTPDRLKDGTLLFLLSDGNDAELRISIDGQVKDFQRVNRYGLPFAMLTCDLVDGQMITIGRE